MRANYTIDGGQLGKQRLEVLHRVHGAQTAELLDRVGLGEAARCVDVGCGSGHVTIELARRAGPAGWAVGIDADADLLDLARADAAEAGASNVDFRCADATELEPASYDLAYARCLLSHVGDPSAVVRVMAAALRPAGVVVVEDIDFRGCFCAPEGGPYQRYVELYRETVRRGGGNADLGPVLPSLLHAAGLERVGASTYQAAALEGDPKLIAALTLERIAQAAVEEKVATADELRQLADELYAFCDDPTTFVAGPRIVQAWGWSPAR